MSEARRSLRTKTTLALVGVALGASLAFAIVWYVTAVRGKREAVNGLLVTSAARAAISVEVFVQAALDGVRVQGRVLAARQLLGDSPAARQEIRSLLTAFRAGDPLHITSMALLALDGRVLETTDGEGTFGRIVTDPFVLRAGTAFTPIATPIRMVAGDDRHGRFRVVVAVRDGSGAPRRLLVAEYSTLVFEQILRGQARLVGADAQGILYDRNLIRLSGTIDTDLLFRTNNPLPDSMVERMVSERRIRTTAPGENARRLVRDIVQLADSTYTYALDQRDRDGRWQKWLGASAPVRPFGGQVSIEWPESIALGATRETLVRDAFVLMLLVTTAVALVAIPVGRRITEPLEALTDTVRRFADGDEGTRATPSGDVETRQLAVAFNDLADRIETLVAGLRERTRALEAELARREELEAQLVQTRKLEAVGKLAGGIAHDFNNLLMVVLANLDFIRESLVHDAEAMDALADVEDAARRGADLTRQLLAFARMGKSVPRTLDLGLAVRSSERLLRQVLGATVELRLALPDHEACIRVDPSQLQQVLLNLAVNARDAMPSGGELLVSVSIDESDCILLVRDTGVGMPPEVSARIFEPFFTTKEAGRGTGLGLSTVYGIVSGSGGVVTVDSAEGIGTSFTIRWPRAAGEPELDLDDSASRRALRGGATILVVDDEPGVRHVVARALRRVGHHVHEAGSGAEGIAVGRIHGHELDLLLTDIEMPHASGHTVAETLKREFPRIRVVMMSGHAIDGGPYPVIEKPFQAEALAGRIEALLAEPMEG